MSNKPAIAFALLACVTLASAQDGGLKPPPTKLDEARTYHTPPVYGTPAAARLTGYEQRLRMEADSPFSQLLWKNIGPEIQSGRVVDIEVPRSRPDLLYVAYATGGLWVSEDKANTWKPLFDKESSFAIGDFAVSPDGKTIWLGTGENNNQRTSYAGTGVFKSSDSGQTWTSMGLTETHRIGRVLMHPKNPNVVYVGAIGALYSRNSARGVYKTSDGGKTWGHVLKIDDLTGVIDMVMDPRNPDVIYAATYERERRAWNFREGGPGTGIYKTVDGGKTWARLGNGLPEWREIGRIGLAISESKPDTLYAFVDNQTADPDTIYHDENTPDGVLTPRRFKLLTPELFLKVDKKVLDRFVASNLPAGTKAEDLLKGIQDKSMTLEDIAAKMEQRNPDVFKQALKEAEVYRTDDGGKTWRKTHAGRIGSHGDYYCGRVFVHPDNPDEVVTLGWELLRSKDGGKTWDEIGERMHVDHHAFYYDPRDPSFQICGNDGGLYLSYDSGGYWRHIPMPVGQFTTIAVDNKTPYNVYGGTQDNGTLKGPNTYTVGRSPISQWSAIGGGDGSAIAVDPRDDGDFVYASFQFGGFYTVDQKTGGRGFLSIRPRKDEKLRWNWISPIQISPHHPDIVMVGSQRLHRSLDKGKTWHDMGDDLTKNLPNGDVPYSTLKEISESPFQFGVIYVGSDDGSVKVTKDHGATWQDISTPAPDKWVIRVVASKWDPATVYVAQNGYRQDDWSPYLWKSTDFGKTWTSIVGNLPSEPINVIREDPNQKHILYVGTDLGVFVSYDSGTNWETLHGGLPRTPVHDIAIQARDKEMVIASHARSIWKLPLDRIYKVDADLRSKDLLVSPIEGMRRDSRWGYARRGEWDTKPPEPPTLDGEVWVKTAGKGSVRITDASGKILLEKAMDWSKGFNFFKLSLELAPGSPEPIDPKSRKIDSVEAVLADPYRSKRPTYLNPGEYKIEVRAGEHVQTLDWKLTE